MYKYHQLKFNKIYEIQYDDVASNFNDIKSTVKS